MQYDSPPLQFICRQWTTTYNRFLISVLALKSLRLNTLPHATIREEVVRTGRDAVELSVVLDSFCFRPMLNFQSTEARIWQAAIQLVSAIRWDVPPSNIPFDVLRKDVETLEKAWNRFLDVVDRASLAEIGETASFGTEDLEQHGIQQILGARCSAPINQNAVYQPLDECVHQLVTRD